MAKSQLFSTTARARCAALALGFCACTPAATEPMLPLPIGTYVAVRAAGRPIGEWIQTGTDSSRVLADTIWFRQDGQARRRGEYVLGNGTSLGPRPVSRDEIVPARLTRDGALQLGGFASPCPNSADCALVELGQFAADSVVLSSTWAQTVRNIVYLRRGE
jgi:hypothetical protein